MMIHKSKESGQILVLLALAIVGVLAFAALAVDVGMVSADRRYAQSVADSAALAGAQKAAMRLENDHVVLTYMTATQAAGAMQQAREAAMANANTNAFTIDTDITDNHGVSVIYDFEPMGGYIDKWIEIKVVLTSTTRMSFAQLFFTDGIKNTVTAVVRVRPRANIAFGYAIAALDTECAANEKTMDFGGTPDVTVTGGGIFSNCNLDFPGGANVEVASPHEIHYVQNVDPEPPLDNVDPDPTPIGTPLPEQNFPVPDCMAIYPTQSTAPNSGPISPGRYDSITPNGTLTFGAGLYCIEGTFRINGDSATGIGVTFIMMEGSADFTIGGNGTVTLSAPNDFSPPAIRGMLVYVVPGNDALIDLSGTSTSTFTGTLYAPDGTVKIAGTPGEEPTYNTQLVGNNVTVVGTATIDIVFDGNQTAQTPAYLDVWR